MDRRIPIIKLYRTLIVSIQVEVSDGLVQELKAEISRDIREQDVDALIIEVSGIDVFDSYIACSIRDIAQICRLMGVRTVLVGLDPGMAITLVEMGMELRDTETALNLERAVERFGGIGLRAAAATTEAGAPELAPAAAEPPWLRLHEWDHDT